MTSFDSPRLLAELGGTRARFTLETAAGQFDHTTSLCCEDHPGFHEAVSHFLNGLPAEQAGRINHAAMAIATAVDGDEVQMTNGPWHFGIEQTRQRLGLQRLVVVNDFTALAMSLPRLTSSQRRQVGGGRARDNSVLGLLGAGTGLGVSGLVPAKDGWVALGTEGGHASFSPRDDLEMAILRHGLQQHPHLSQERLLSEPGIELTHRALREHAGLAPQPLSAAVITRRALDGSDAVCVDVMNTFCAMLGSAAANLALTLGAQGGIFIGGSIVPGLGRFFDRSPFRARFEDKGRFSDYLKAIPTWVITAEDATFIGTSAILAAQLRTRRDEEASALLAHIQRSRRGLSPAERRVADHVLAHPRSALGDPISEIAKSAQVSQPTVIRFCRSLGCDGLSDFKLRLASGLSGSVPLGHTQVMDTDNTLELGVKVLGNTAGAVLQLREQLKHETLSRAVEGLTGAERIEFCALGSDAVVADDARFKFLRLGLPSASCCDAHLQPLVAALLKPSHVLVLISSGGPVDTLLGLADTARQRGAMVMALCGSQSPLVRKADAALTLDHDENPASQLPMVSRILQLLLIDILAVGVALKNGGQALNALTAAHTADPPGRAGASTEPPPAAAKAEALGTHHTDAPHRPGLHSR